MKVYIITKGYFSGNKVDDNYVKVLGVYNDKEIATKALAKVMDEEVAYCGSDEIETDTLDCGSHYLELTDFSEDYRIVLELHEEDIK